MKLFIGIDGGQTSTKCILADQTGKVLGVGEGGPCIHLKDEDAREHARKVLYKAIHQALVAAGLSDTMEIESAFVGITGVSGPQAPAAITYREGVLGQFRIKLISIDHDARVALAGAIPTMIGVIAIAGTGSIAFGMNANGESARAGGWGYLLGDPGSAYEMGRQALIAICGEQDGTGPPTALTPRVLELLGIKTADLIPQVIYRDPAPKLRFASICKLITEVAEAGDPLASGIFSQGAKSLARMTCAVIRKLGMSDAPLCVSGSGGVFQSGELIWKPYREEVLAHYPEASVIRPRFNPLHGSLLLALKQAGIALNPDLMQ